MQATDKESVAVLSWSFYRKLGFLQMLTAMAIFEDQAAAVARGHLSES